MIGYGASSLVHDFFAYNNVNQVWNGSAFVTWDDDDFASYRITATQQGSSGWFVGSAPTGTERYELRERGATLASSYMVWFNDTDATLGRIEARALLIGNLSANDVSSQPSTNKLVGPYVIGDDYLDATDNAISINVTVTFQPTSCFLAFESEKGAVLGPITGEVDSYTDGVAAIHFDIPRATTDGVLRPGPYDYSIEIRGSGANEVTIMHSKIAGQKVIWLRKFT